MINTYLNVLADNCYEVAHQREENGANISCETISMLKHCAGEVIEATEAYKNIVWGDKKFEEQRDDFAKELADIICCVLIIASNNNLDIDKALNDVMAKNRLRAEGKGDKK